MKKVKKPKCMPGTRGALREWNSNFMEKAPPLTDKYGIAKPLSDTMVANGETLETAYAVQDIVRAYDTALQEYIDDLLNLNPANPAAEIAFPVMETLPTLPLPTRLAILLEAVQMVNAFSTSPIRTDVELKALKIEADSQEPTPTEINETVVVPELKAFVNNGYVNLKITKKTPLTGITSVVEVDDTGLGQYYYDGVSTNSKYKHLIVLPAGVLTAIRSFRVVFMRGQEQIGQAGYVSIVVTASDVVTPLNVAPPAPAATAKTKTT